MKPWEVHASRQVRLDVSKGISRLTAARLVADDDAHESAVDVWDLATEPHKQHSDSMSSTAPLLILSPLRFRCTVERRAGGFLSDDQ